MTSLNKQAASDEAEDTSRDDKMAEMIEQLSAD